MKESYVEGLAAHDGPLAYVRDVLTRIASHPHHRLGELLPGRWKPLDE